MRCSRCHLVACSEILRTIVAIVPASRYRSDGVRIYSALCDLCVQPVQLVVEKALCFRSGQHCHDCGIVCCNPEAAHVLFVKRTHSLDLRLCLPCLDRLTEQLGPDDNEQAALVQPTLQMAAMIESASR